jgi:hypothetical protein
VASDHQSFTNAPSLRFLQPDDSEVYAFPPDVEPVDDDDDDEAAKRAYKAHRQREVDRASLLLVGCTRI